MTLTEAEVIYDNARNNDCTFVRAPRPHVFGPNEKSVVRIRLDGDFSAEELEAFSMLCRAASLGTAQRR